MRLEHEVCYRERVAIHKGGPYGRKHYIARTRSAAKTAFIISCIGSAVGLSGIWLFPYRVSQYGGAAFLIPYLFFVVVLGITGVIGEMAFGRAWERALWARFRRRSKCAA